MEVEGRAWRPYSSQAVMRLVRFLVPLYLFAGSKLAARMISIFANGIPSGV